MDPDTSYSSEEGSKKSRKKKKQGAKKKSTRRTDGLYECELCDEVFIEKWEFNEHFKEKHKTTPPNHLVNKVKVESQASDNVMVVSVTPAVEGQEGFFCNVCGQRTSSKYGLDRHHSLLHGADKNQRGFRCEDCDKTFKLQQHLNRHKKMTHEASDDSDKENTNTERKWKCTKEKCDRSFKYERNLKRHVETVHENRRVFKCHLCPTDFGRKDHWQRHYRRCHIQTQPENIPDNFSSNLENIQIKTAQELATTSSKATSLAKTTKPEAENKTRQQRKRPYPEEEVNVNSEINDDMPLFQIQQINAIKTNANRESLSVEEKVAENTEDSEGQSQTHALENESIENSTNTLEERTATPTPTYYMELKSYEDQILMENVQEDVVEETEDADVQSQTHALEKETIENSTNTFDEPTPTAISFLELDQGQKLVENAQDELILSEVDDEQNQRTPSPIYYMELESDGDQTLMENVPGDQPIPLDVEEQNQSHNEKSLEEDLLAPVKLENLLSPLDLSETSALLDFEDLSGSVEYLDMNAPYDLDLARDINNIIETITANIQAENKMEESMNKTSQTFPTPNCQHHFHCNGSHSEHDAENADTNNINNISMMVQNGEDISFGSDSDSTDVEDNQLTSPQTPLDSASSPSNGKYEDHDHSQNCDGSQNSEPDADTNNIQNISMMVQNGEDISFGSVSDSTEDEENQLTSPTSELQTPLDSASNLSNGKYEDHGNSQSRDVGPSQREYKENRGYRRKKFMPPVINGNEDGSMSNDQDKNCSIQ